jgi:hypothetical protein
LNINVYLMTVQTNATVSVESTGCIPPEKIFPESILVMRRKIQAMKKATEKLLEDDDEDGDIQMKSTAE